MNDERMLQAARGMREAADTMQRTQAFQQETLARHEMFMTEWIARFEAAVEVLAALGVSPPEEQS